MAEPQRSQRVLIALALAGRGGADLREAQFRNAFERIAGQPGRAGFGVRAGCNARMLYPRRNWRRPVPPLRPPPSASALATWSS